MKAEEMKPCALCGKGMMHAGVPLYYRVRVEHFGVDLTAVQQTVGLEMMMGNVAIARAMGPDPDIGVLLGEPQQALICQPCMLEKIPMLMIATEGK